MPRYHVTHKVLNTASGPPTQDANKDHGVQQAENKQESSANLRKIHLKR
jgi:hypothetical protein